MSLARNQLIHSPEVELVGMNIESFDGRINHYHFKHQVDGCGAVFRMSVLEFVDLIPEPVPSAINFGNESCEKHCLDLNDHGTCSQRCRWSPFRRFMDFILSDPDKLQAQDIFKDSRS
ncbi:MAG: hypothetical protein JSU96_20545 [Acidobacteriota bacterium]|nr:MAG: hypothetical protein JSU96_20545 [Acidobacteriota bacterium]